jgi:protein nanos 1
MLRALQIGGLTKTTPADVAMPVYHPEPVSEPTYNGSGGLVDEYNAFHDYLGLFNVVSNMREQNLTTHIRERRDSLGSAASSEFSICTGSADSTESNTDYFTYPGSQSEYFRQQYEPEDMLAQMSTDHLQLQRSSSTLIERGNLSIRLPNRPLKQQVCVFCRNNGESESFYTSHCLKDSEGKVTCPVLRAYTCPLCGANGDASHTIKYCPENSQASKVSTVAAQMKRATITITRKK